jgi:hypothetical protein
MMIDMFLLFVLCITLLTAILPYLAKQMTAIFPQIKVHTSYDWLPVLAAFLFIVAFFLPNIHISDETTTFQQHFVGGGMYTACLYIYFKKLLSWKLSLFVSFLVLFAWASTFGVATELLEFTLTKLNLAQIGTGDTDWDLLANTLGALTGYAILLLAKIGKD